MPQAFLSFDEFKQTLTDRVQKQKEEVREDATNYKQKNGNNNTNAKSEKEIPEAPEIEKIANIAEGYDIYDSLHTKSTVTKTTHNIYIYHILPDGTRTKLFRRTTLKGLILGALEKAATDHTITTAKNDNETSENTTMTELKPKEEIGTAKDSKEIKAESFVPSKKKTTELVTNADVTETSELEATTLTAMETEMTETVTEEFSTTSMSTRATLGRPAVYIGR
ncbi:hypothetical protein MSG28_009210 [Choristoneura fumiferana]|uniref:Uncharacterized protein n=1 Tax=Choristoneura fumiferana TaxID=7141 RepID=A0ACC0KXL3_CHOFU|nr:hypothetical protein MSG28_009210 [Choristoneura fumiferana]